mmetsp:Transcript_36029/g.95669  ORF Transcript_36029/g.95669 Transcript_36029/m.95669 type:complete len:262 (+) Transcript_36029:544-1329(+)
MGYAGSLEVDHLQARATHNVVRMKVAQGRDDARCGRVLRIAKLPVGKSREEPMFFEVLQAIHVASEVGPQVTPTGDVRNTRHRGLNGCPMRVKPLCWQLVKSGQQRAPVFPGLKTDQTERRVTLPGLDEAIATHSETAWSELVFAEHHSSVVCPFLARRDRAGVQRHTSGHRRTANDAQPKVFPNSVAVVWGHCDLAAVNVPLRTAEHYINQLLVIQRRHHEIGRRSFPDGLRSHSHLEVRTVHVLQPLQKLCVVELHVPL